MISQAPDVPTYLAELPANRRPTLERLRALCLQSLPGYEECMQYGLPCYRRNGRMEVSFASQKQHISLYVMKQDVVDSFRSSLTTASIGKGCIRFTYPERMNFEVIERLLQATAASSSNPC